MRTHYENLKVARDAPQEVIRAAYKTLSQKYHPDRNPGNVNAGKIMAILNTSYDVLSDPDKRRAHDLWIAQQERTSAQPKHESTSPSPPRYSPPPTKPRRAHTFLLHVTRYWLFYGVACIILWANFFAKPSTPPPGPKPYQAAAPLVAPNPTTTPSHTTCRAIGSTRAVYACTYPDGSRTYSSKLPRDAILAPGVAQDVRRSANHPSQGEERAYVKPVNAPNGRPWPSSAGYVQGFPRANTDGFSNVTVDNGQNDSDVFVKLVSIGGDRAYPVRQFYIPAFESFTVKKVTAGSYDIRYRDLDTGGLSRSDAFTLEENPTDDGVQYSNITMTLYKVQNGNMQIFPLAESEF